MTQQGNQLSGASAQTHNAVQETRDKGLSVLRRWDYKRGDPSQKAALELASDGAAKVLENPGLRWKTAYRFSFTATTMVTRTPMMRQDQAIIVQVNTGSFLLAPPLEREKPMPLETTTTQEVVFLAPLDHVCARARQGVVRLRLRMGGLQASSPAQVRLLHVADSMGRPSRRPCRQQTRPDGQHVRRPGFVIGG